jgi:hypothetical protein
MDDLHLSEEPPDHEQAGRPQRLTFEGEDAARRLSELGLESEWLELAVHRGFLAYRDTNHPHFPRTIAPINEWGFTNKFVRDELVPRAWTLDDTTGVALTVDPTQAFCISAVSGNAYTGNPLRTPSSKHPRGPLGEELIRQNQLELFAEHAEMPLRTGGRLQYLLLYYFWESEDRVVLRAELSLPEATDEKGYIISWRERIILPTRDLTRGPSTARTADDAPTSPSEPAFRIKRREAS